MKTLEFENTKNGILKLNQLLPALLSALKDGKKYILEIKEYRKKRSLSANGYYWVLLEKIAKVLKTSKDELHEIMLQRYGTYYTDENETVIKISSGCEINPLECGIHCKFIGSSELNGNMFYHYILIKGSHLYDTKEMSDLINGVVSEAKELDIETLTPDEIARLQYEE